MRTVLATERGEASIYAEMRRHIAALPSNVVNTIRFKALYAYRFLENSHPAEPDRMRAAMFVGSDVPTAYSGSERLAGELIVPTRQSNANESEKKLTGMLFA